VVAENLRVNIPEAMRERVYVRDGFTCQYCGHQGQRDTICCDHLTPVVAGGENREDNLVTCCNPCNNMKGAKRQWVHPETGVSAAALAAGIASSRIMIGHVHHRPPRQRRTGAPKAVSQATFERLVGGGGFPGLDEAVQRIEAATPRIASLIAAQSQDTAVQVDKAVQGLQETLAERLDQADGAAVQSQREHAEAFGALRELVERQTEELAGLRAELRERERRSWWQRLIGRR
jgi:hypothetical protein